MSTPETEARQPRHAAASPSQTLRAIATGLGCLASLVVAFFAISAYAFAAWMTAMPPGMATMSHEQAVQQARVGLVVLVIACLVGAWLLVRIVRAALHPRSRAETDAKE